MSDESPSPSPTPPSPQPHGSMGVVVGGIVVVGVLILGGLYIWGAYIEKQRQMNIGTSLPADPNSPEQANEADAAVPASASGEMETDLVLPPPPPPPAL